MSWLKYLSPFHWAEVIKEKTIMGTIGKYVGGFLRTGLAAGLGALAAAGLLSPEQVEQASVAFGPVADALVGLLGVLIWSFIQKKNHSA